MERQYHKAGSGVQGVRLVLTVNCMERCDVYIEVHP